MFNIIKNQKGFTLIELMIVVAIIGILAAIAIPNFMRYQLKSKSAEAKINLKAIMLGEQTFKSELDGFVLIAPHPAVGPFATKQPWGNVLALNTPKGGGPGTFTDIGFEPNGSDVFYTYAVNTGPAAMGANHQVCTADALSDLDGDSNMGQFAIANADSGPIVACTQGATPMPLTVGEIDDVARGFF